MKELFFQKTGKTATPFSEEDAFKWADFKDNQVLRCQIYGVKKPRSLQQLRLFWAVCRTVAENTEDENWNTPEKAALQCKIKTQFIDMNKSVVSDGKFYPHFRSIAFKNLDHMEACGFFNMSFEIMAQHLGTTTEELLENS